MGSDHSCSTAQSSDVSEARRDSTTTSTKSSEAAVERSSCSSRASRSWTQLCESPRAQVGEGDGSGRRVRPNSSRARRCSEAGSQANSSAPRCRSHRCDGIFHRQSQETCREGTQGGRQSKGRVGQSRGTVGVGRRGCPRRGNFVSTLSGKKQMARIKVLLPQSPADFA